MAYGCGDASATTPADGTGAARAAAPPPVHPPKKIRGWPYIFNLDTFGATPCLDKPPFSGLVATLWPVGFRRGFRKKIAPIALRLEDRHTGHAFAESDGEFEKVYPRGRPKRHGGGSVAWKL